jgi:hypothetical protein
MLTVPSTAHTRPSESTSHTVSPSAAPPAPARSRCAFAASQAPAESWAVRVKVWSHNGRRPPSLPHPRPRPPRLDWVLWRGHLSCSGPWRAGELGAEESPGERPLPVWLWTVVCPGEGACGRPCGRALTEGSEWSWSRSAVPPALPPGGRQAREHGVAAVGERREGGTSDTHRGSWGGGAGGKTTKGYVWVGKVCEDFEQEVCGGVGRGHADSGKGREGD